MNRREEHIEKVSCVRKWLSTHNYNGALFTTQNNFSWITSGGEAYVVLGKEGAVGSILVTNDKVVLLTNMIEQQRLLEEEKLNKLGIEVKTWPWYKITRLEEAVALFADPSKIVVDRAGLGHFRHEENLAELRYTLLPPEIDRYRQLAQEGAQIVEHVCHKVVPEQTELEVAALVAKGCWERSILPLVVLIAADERIQLYRHPIPTEKRIKKIVMVVLGGRRNGLHVSLTRIVAFGKINDELRHRHETVTTVDTAYILGSRPGRALNEVLSEGLHQYKVQGFPDEWELHHQGGLTGYATREIIATPSSTYKLQAGESLAWNPSITGTKSEDTILITDKETGILTQTDTWPNLKVTIDGKSILRPDILIR